MAAWRKRDGAPATPDVKERTAYVTENGLGLTGNRTSASREVRLAANSSKRNRLLDFEFAVKRREMVSRADVNARLLPVS